MSRSQLLDAIRGKRTGSAEAWAALHRLGSSMDEADVARDSPSRTVFIMIGDRWTTLILLVMATGEWHYGVLRRIVSALSEDGAISQRVLTLKLRALERNGFVARRIVAAKVAMTSYQLTDLGRELEGHVSNILSWSSSRQERILTERAAFDERRRHERRF